MELYFSPLACSLATRIALYEAGAAATFTYVDLKAKRTADGSDYFAIHPLGQVPALRTPGGAVLTENTAILQYVADSYPEAKLAPTDLEGRARLHQWLGYISTELHKGVFALHFDRDSNDALKAHARHKVTSRFQYVEQHLANREYLLDQFTVADAYLATVLTWTKVTGPELGAWPGLQAYQRRVFSRPAVAKASGEEFVLYGEEQKRQRA